MKRITSVCVHLGYTARLRLPVNLVKNMALPYKKDLLRRFKWMVTRDSEKKSVLTAFGLVIFKSAWLLPCFGQIKNNICAIEFRTDFIKPAALLIGLHVVITF